MNISRVKSMRKRLAMVAICLVFAFVALVPTGTGMVSADTNELIIKVDGIAVISDVSPVLINSRLLVPLRYISEALGAEVKWDQETKTALVTVDEGITKQTIEVAIDVKSAVVNGVLEELEVPAQLINGRTMVPVRFLAETLNFEVNYFEGVGVDIISQDKDIEKVERGKLNSLLETKVTWEKQAEGIELVLEVSNPEDGQQVELTQYSGQEYEIIVYDQIGEKFWQYSDDRAFIQPILNITFAPGEKKVFSELIPTLEAGSYHVEVYYMALSREVPVEKFELTID